MKHFYYLFFLLLSQSVLAVDLKPHPTAHITDEQWSTYHAQIERDYGHTRKSYPKHNLETFQVPELRANIAFTMPGHEAHPSWVTRYVSNENGTVDINQIGYFAGDEEAFAKLFSQYQQLTERTRREMARQNESE